MKNRKERNLFQNEKRSIAQTHWMYPDKIHEEETTLDKDQVIDLKSITRLCWFHMATEGSLLIMEENW